MWCGQYISLTAKKHTFVLSFLSSLPFSTNHLLASIYPACRSSLSLRIPVFDPRHYRVSCTLREQIRKMVSLSLTISISSHPSPQITQPTAQLPNTHHSTPPSIHQSHPHSRPQSLCPSYANSLAPTYKSSLRPESLEHLLGSGSSFERRESGTGSGSRKRVSVVQIENGRLKRRILSTGMDGHGHESEGVRERKKSYGIGGAGNIRMSSFLPLFIFC